jgi:hypothetical protein
MFSSLKFWGVLVGLVIVVGLMTNSASAVTVEIAKKCNALTAEAFPPREVGNPAAGSAKGTGRAERAYYRKCVANRGKIVAPAR